MTELLPCKRHCDRDPNGSQKCHSKNWSSHSVSLVWQLTNGDQQNTFVGLSGHCSGGHRDRNAMDENCRFTEIGLLASGARNRPAYFSFSYTTDPCEFTASSCCTSHVSNIVAVSTRHFVRALEPIYTPRTNVPAGALEVRETKKK